MTMDRSDHQIGLTKFQLDDRSYSTLVDWSRARTRGDNDAATVVLRGLHEILALSVPA